MDFTQQTTQTFGYPKGYRQGHCHLKWVNFESKENYTSHETEGLGENLLVVRRGRPFKLTLMFEGRSWEPSYETLSLEVWLGNNISAHFPVLFSDDEQYDPKRWSAKIYPQDGRTLTTTVHVCSPVLSSVASYTLKVHIQSHTRLSYVVGAFVLLCNPWHEDDPVYMPMEGGIKEYMQSDFGLVFVGSRHNFFGRPWSYGQYEPGVLEACLRLLQVSPKHRRNPDKDYIRRASPIYLSKVICAMVNCSDRDFGILDGKWSGPYLDGVPPTEWSGSGDIVRSWDQSNCRAVKYGQCWVFASVLCTVMRVLGIPSRVVTVFNAAHDTNENMTIEEYFSTKGEKLDSKDSVWNFHVWVECWMRRPDLGDEFDGWQVVDPTPQERNQEGVFCCGPCPVVAIKKRQYAARYDAPFIGSSVDADVVHLIVQAGRVVLAEVDRERVGRLILTKGLNSDRAEDLTHTYKSKRERHQPRGNRFCTSGQLICDEAHWPLHPSKRTLSWNPNQGEPLSSCFPESRSAMQFGGDLLMARSSSSLPMSVAGLRAEEPSEQAGLEVSLTIEGSPSVGESIEMTVAISNHSSRPREVVEHLNAQLKDYNRNPQKSFWKDQKKCTVLPGEVARLQHSLPPSEYEGTVAADDIVNMAVVVKDLRTRDRAMDTHEFNLRSPQIHIEIEGAGDSILQVKKEYTVNASFANIFGKTLSGAELTVQGPGLLKGKEYARLGSMKPGESIEKQVSVSSISPGTKVLTATFSHSSSPNVVSRTFHKVTVEKA